MHVPDFEAQQSKIHLATHNGTENPLDVYLSGNFEAWQRNQTRRNFGRKFVISLISLPLPNTWLFAGLHTSGQPTQIENKTFEYPLVAVEACQSLNGRLVLQFERNGRQAYLDTETWAANIEVKELRPTRLAIADFPGYKAVHITKEQLDLIVREQLPEWRSALASVAGVYLISDSKTGRHYVGSATGENGIWGRWCEYAKNGHGGNVGIRTIMLELGSDHIRNLRYSILEIADTHASQTEILQRESHWKKVLLTREYGLNEN